MQRAPITAAWAGYIDSTPDGIPAISEVPGLPGLILAAGFSGHGFGIGPGAGHLVGLSVGMAMLVGQIISWVIAVPILTSMGAPGPDQSPSSTSSPSAPRTAPSRRP